MSEGKHDDVSHYVRIKSAEGHEFVVSREAAMVSGTIKAMLSGDFKEARGEICFPEITTAVLEKVIQYCHYKHRYENASGAVPEFEVKPEYALELLMAANYLDC
jgi:transcription elongation factor B subunit 1